jgi:hypothetical protein
LDWFDELNSFVLNDSTLEDLTIQLSHLPSWQVSEFDREKQEKEFKIEKAGVYEVYVENNQLITETSTNNESSTNVRMEIKVDGKQIRMDAGYQIPDTGRKYVKIGETSTNNESNTNIRMERKRKEHTIQIKMQNANSKNKEQKLKIILVNKEERKRAEREIWKKINEPKTELCYIFKKEKGEFWVP